MPAITKEEWEKHNELERRFWGVCTNTYEEQLKQDVYAKYMGLDQFAGAACWFSMQGKSIIDIGGGPVSLLLRCGNYAYATLVDPCMYPEWVRTRYRLAGIEYVQKLAEEFVPAKSYDEAWIYNVLQHVQDPGKVIKNARMWAKTVRICDHLDIGSYMGHPHNLTREWLDEMLSGHGSIVARNDFAARTLYYAVFNYDNNKMPERK